MFVYLEDVLDVFIATSADPNGVCSIKATMNKKMRDSLLKNHADMAVAVTVGCHRPWRAGNKEWLWQRNDGREASIEAKTFIVPLSAKLLEIVEELFDHRCFGQGLILAGPGEDDRPNLRGVYGAARRFCLNLANPDLAAKFRSPKLAGHVFFDWGNGHDSEKARARIFESLDAGVVLHAGLIIEPSTACADPNSPEAVSWEACRAEIMRISGQLLAMEHLGAMDQALEFGDDFGVSGLNLGDLGAVKSFCEKGRILKGLGGDPDGGGSQAERAPRRRSL